MRFAFVAALTLASAPAFAQTTDAPSSYRGAGFTRTAAYVGSADCMGLWEPATHMSKQEWGRTCRRVQGRLQEIRQIETSGTQAPPDHNK